MKRFLLVVLLAAGYSVLVIHAAIRFVGPLWPA